MNNGLEEITVHNYNWQTDTDQETGYTVIYSWAFNKDSKPYLLRFHEFDCFCYVELPLFLNNSYVTWDGFRSKLIYEKICFILGDDRPYRYKFEKKEKYYYYKGKNKKYPMLLLCFRSLNSMDKCKNILKSGFKVNGLRGNGRKDDMTMVCVRVWETYIPLERKLLTLKNTKYCQWFKVSGIKVHGEDKISNLENEYVVDWRSIKSIPLDETVTWLTYPGILSFDLETYSDRHNAMPDSLNSKHVVYLCSIVYQKFLHPETRKKIIILLGDCSETNLAEVIKVKTELELINKIQDSILEFDPEIITGYNIFAYDNPYLSDRLKRKLKDWGCLGRLLGVKSEMKHISWSSSAYKNQDFYILQMNGRISVDLLSAVKRDHKLPLYNLDYVSNHFLKKGKHPVKVQQMFEAFELQNCLEDNYDPNIEVSKSFLKHCKKIDKLDVLDGKESKEYKEEVKQKWLKEYKQFALDEMKKVVDYCVVDSDLVIDLFDKLNIWIGLVQLSNIMGINPEDIFTKGTGIRMTSQIYDEASKEGIVLDEVDFPKENIEGGFVFDPIPGIYKYILVFDFKSLYPSVMIAHNMDHSTMLNPNQMDLVPDEECHVIEWDEYDEEELNDKEEEEDQDLDLDLEINKDVIKKDKRKVVHRKYKFVKEKIGIMPKLLVRLIEERTKVREKQKSVEKGSVEWNVLEQTQLGIKCSSNAFYGACASSFSKLRLPPAAACITAKARESTKKMNKYLEDKGHRVIYGDSVTGDTPILVSINGEEKFIYIEELMKEEVKNKSYKIPKEEIKVWSDIGFTKIKHVMKHKTNKRIFCIVTTSGIIKVTEDHSLLNPQGKEISPKDIKVGDFLLTKEHKIKKDFYNTEEIFKSSLEAMKKVIQLKNIGYNVYYDYIDGYYKIFGIKEKIEEGKILKIIDLGIIDDYVYDLETENHHFSAGVGELVVHNTDSTMPDVGITDPKKAREIGYKLAEELSSLYPKPMEIEFECTYHRMLCIKKKMYLCTLLNASGEEIDNPDMMKIRGVTLARRDNCKFQRDFYKSAVWKILHDETFINIFNFIIEKCIELVSHSVKWEELVMIKGLGSNYKNKNFMMNLFAQEMQKSGNPLVAGDRIPYLVVKSYGIDEREKQKVGYKMRTIDLYTERTESDTPEHIDYLHYLEKTIKNGIEKQLYQVGYQKELKELEEKYVEIDQDRFFKALEKEIIGREKELKDIKCQGYKNMISKLFKENGGDKIKVIEKLLEDPYFSKIAKPLYNFHIKRRKGRGKRLSSRIDKEPILMFVRIARAKEEVMRSIREKKEREKRKVEKESEKINSKKLTLKILPSINSEKLQKIQEEWTKNKK